jgi:hypothetical protein
MQLGALNKGDKGEQSAASNGGVDNLPITCTRPAAAESSCTAGLMLGKQEYT